MNGDAHRSREPGNPVRLAPLTNLLLVAALSFVAAVTAASGWQVYQLTDAVHVSQAGHDVSATAQIDGPADVSGQTAWAVSNGSLYLSGNSGHSWSTLALPAGVSGHSVAAVTASAGSAVWLAVEHGSAVELFRRGIAGQSAWTMTALPSSAAPAGASPGQSPNQVVISQGSAGTVILLEVWDQSASASIPRLFVSSNDGASFTQLAQPNRELPYLGLPWWTAVFASAKDGVAVVTGSTVPGPVPMAADGNVVWLVQPGRAALVSRDNGRTWTRISLPFAGATAVSSAGPASATIVAGGGHVCSGPKQQSKCTAQAVKLWSTPDDGLSWQDVTPG